MTHHHAPHPVQLAGIAQKMINILFINCPANYQCGGPAYAAQNALDSILHLMGIGVAMLQRQRRADDMSAFERQMRHDAVCGNSILKGFVQHKSQVLGSGLYSLLANIREKSFRESDEVTEEALLMIMQYYFHKTGASKEDFWKRLQTMDHDELIQLEKAAP